MKRKKGQETDSDDDFRLEDFSSSSPKKKKKPQRPSEDPPRSLAPTPAPALSSSKQYLEYDESSESDKEAEKIRLPTIRKPNAFVLPVAKDYASRRHHEACFECGKFPAPGAPVRNCPTCDVAVHFECARLGKDAIGFPENWRCLYCLSQPPRKCYMCDSPCLRHVPLENGQVDLFTCRKCRSSAHRSCVGDSLLPFLLTHWECQFCLKWPWTIDTILTFRPVETVSRASFAPILTEDKLKYGKDHYVEPGTSHPKLIITLPPSNPGSSSLIESDSGLDSDDDNDSEDDDDDEYEEYEEYERVKEKQRAPKVVKKPKNLEEEDDSDSDDTSGDSDFGIKSKKPSNQVIVRTAEEPKKKRGRPPKTAPRTGSPPLELIPRKELTLHRPDIRGQVHASFGTEFLVKFKEMSHFHDAWVPEWWLGKIAQLKLKNFKNKNVIAPALAQVLPTAWLQIDRILDKAEDVHGSLVRSLKLIKWKSLNYDQTSWEEDKDLDTHSPGYINARRMYDLHQSLEISKKPKKYGFKEFLTQPDFVTASELHPHQISGLNWLLYNFSSKKNCILADEMGLGKTIQTITFLVSLYEDSKVAPFLVLVPLSTASNWEREFAKWAPQLYTVTLTGNISSRETIKKFELFPPGKKSPGMQAHVVITSYEMLMMEKSVLTQTMWEAIVVDEGQRLKNQDSKLFKELSEFKSNFRLLLTGTPLQNSLKELFTLLSFLDSEKFKDPKALEEEFARLDDEDKVKNLHNQLRPHILRRIKEEVLKDLPKKVEVIVPVQMSTLQKELYRAVLTKNYEILNGGNKASNKASLLNVMMELRKCSNHPYLLPNIEPELGDSSEILKRMYEASGKMTLLHHMLARLKERGHRVLIFSQMTRVLDIMEDYFNLLRWSYCRLDGGTSQYDRQLLIDQYNAPDSPHFCFLLSTRAGGLGINLTSADTIFIYDCDFNPHNDLQAQSRAHRIGQVRPVMVYKLVSAAGVEEKILQSAAQKLALDHLVVEKMTTGMKAAEIEQILRSGAQALFSETNLPEGPVTFDDALIENLLDRDRLIVEENRKAEEKEREKESQESSGKEKPGFFSSFNVAQIWKEESPAEKVEAPDEYWAELLKGRVEAAQASKRDDLGQVRRSRRTISYSTLVDSDKETSDSSFKHHSSSSSDADFEAAFEVERFPTTTVPKPQHQYMDVQRLRSMSPVKAPDNSKKLREVPVKPDELYNFIESSSLVAPNLREALLLFLTNPQSMDFPQTAPFFVELSKEDNLELFLKIDPKNSQWKVLSSIPKPKPKAPARPPPSSNPPHHQAAEEENRKAMTPTSPLVDDEKDFFPLDAELDEAFEFYTSCLIPRFQELFPDMPLEDISRLIFLRWQTLPYEEQAVYLQAMLATSPPRSLEEA